MELSPTSPLVQDWLFNQELGTAASLVENPILWEISISYKLEKKISTIKPFYLYLSQVNAQGEFKYC